MKNDIGYSGTDIIGDVSWGTHLCQFYQTREDLMDITLPYLKAGLESNEICIWITSCSLKAEEAKKALREAIPDFDVYLEKRQIEIVSCGNWHLKDGVFDSKRALNGLIGTVNKSLASGYNGLRLIEDTCWLEKGNRNDLISYERKLDSIIGKYPVISLCTYSLGLQLVNILVEHIDGCIKLERDQGTKFTIWFNDIQT
jgi:hypothetical protein